MILFPAIDLVGGKVVRLARGERAHMDVYSDDPAALERTYQLFDEYLAAAEAVSAYVDSIEADPGQYALSLNTDRTGNAAAALAAILVAVAVYGILIVALRALTREDLMLMPKGEKIARLLHL